MMIFGNLALMSVMMKIKGRKAFGGLLLLSVLIFLILFCVRGMGPVHGRQPELQTFQSGDGWGYQITYNNKTFIYQPTVPAIDTIMPFPSEKSAKKVGSLVMKRLREDKSPAISREEVVRCL